jgi:hypothetical protein
MGKIYLSRRIKLPFQLVGKKLDFLVFGMCIHIQMVVCVAKECH